MRLGICLRIVTPLALVALGAFDGLADDKPYFDKSSKETIRWPLFPSDKSHKEAVSGPMLATAQLSGEPPGASTQNPAAVARLPERLDDRKILQVTHVTNQSEIEQARLAKARATDPDVRRLADEILRKHAAADKKELAIAKQRAIGMTPSRLSDRLMSENKDTVSALSEKTGPEFDRAYVDAQVEAHKQVLQLIDQQLVPNARDEGVKRLVFELRPQITEQLDTAKALQQKLKE